MLSTTALGTLLHVASGGRVFRIQAEKSERPVPDKKIVTWDGENDPENPKNWPMWFKCWITFLICTMTVFVYLGSSIVVPGLPLIADEFHVSESVAGLSMSLFIWGYGVGPLVLSPITEVAKVGRTWPYVASIGLFVILQVPTALCGNLPGFLVLRFLAGFLGSPVLATGGASMGDVWNLDGGFMNAIGCWGFAACGGPGMGPLLSGFATQDRGWHWTIWPLLCGTGLVWLVTVALLPETSSAAILSRRARALRRATGDASLVSEGELKDASMTPSHLLYETLCRPVLMTFTEPVLFFSDLYIAYIYGITFCFFEAFPLTFQGHHGFSLGKSSSCFITGWVVCSVALLLYCLYNVYVAAPRFASGRWRPEFRMEACFLGGVLFPISLFWFGWTSFGGVHWSVPLLAYGFFQCAVFYLFQGFLGYLGENYPIYMASAYASNGLFRALLGGAFPLFSTQMFRRLTIQGGCSLLGGLAILLLPITGTFYWTGPRLRARSKMAGTTPAEKAPSSTEM